MNVKQRVFSPARISETSPKSTSACSPGACVCGTNPCSVVRPGPAWICGRRRATQSRTMAYDTPPIAYSSTSRARTRRAVCCCLRCAVRSSRSIASINGFDGSSFGAANTRGLRAGGAAATNAWRTVRRCTP